MGENLPSVNSTHNPKTTGFMGTFATIPDVLIQTEFSSSGANFNRRMMCTAKTHRDLLKPSTSSRLLVTSGHVTSARSMPRQRRLSELPTADMSDYNESVLVVDCDAGGHAECLLDVVAGAFEALASGYKPLHTVSLTCGCNPLIGKGGCKLFSAVWSQRIGLHPAFASVHTLHLSGGRLKSPNPTTAIQHGHFPGVRRLILERFNDLSFSHLLAVFPDLESLQISDLHYVTGYDHLVLFSRLVDFSSSLSSSYVDNWRLVAGIRGCSSLQRLHLQLGSLSPSMCETLCSLTSLRGLSVGFSHFEGDDEVDHIVHDAMITQLPSSLTSLRWVACLVEYAVQTQSHWTCLQQLHVRDSATIPASSASSLKRLVLEPCAGYTRPPLHRPSQQFPNLVNLAAPYNQLISLDCPKITTLDVHPPGMTTPATSCASHAESIGVLTGRLQAGAWRDLTILAICPEACFGVTCHGLYNEFVGEFLEMLADRLKCLHRITLFTEFSDNDRAINALCRMPSLATITLVATRISLQQLRCLVALASMETIELVGAEVVNDLKVSANLETVRAQLRPGTQILLREGLESLAERYWSPSKIEWQ